jgi:hypothetical protein
MESLSGKQEDMVDVNLKSTAAHLKPDGKQGGCSC